MKKLFLLFAFAVFSTGAYAQFTLGIKAAPTLAFNRVEDTYQEDNETAINDYKVGLRFKFGPIADIHFSENYALSTGLIYAAKRAGIERQNYPGKNNNFQHVYNLQYIQIPATIKLFTNEMMENTRLYFQVGAAPEIKIAEKLNEEKSNNAFKTKEDGEEKLMESVFRFYDASLVTSMGIEMQMGTNTKFFSGITYNRGLINVLKDVDPSNLTFNRNEEINIYKNDIIGIEAGLKF